MEENNAFFVGLDSNKLFEFILEQFRQIFTYENVKSFYDFVNCFSRLSEEELAELEENIPNSISLFEKRPFFEQIGGTLIHGQLGYKEFYSLSQFKFKEETIPVLLRTKFLDKDDSEKSKEIFEEIKRTSPAIIIEDILPSGISGISIQRRNTKYIIVNQLLSAAAKSKNSFHELHHIMDDNLDPKCERELAAEIFAMLMSIKYDLTEGNILDSIIFLANILESDKEVFYKSIKELKKGGEQQSFIYYNRLKNGIQNALKFIE